MGGPGVWTKDSEEASYGAGGDSKATLAENQQAPEMG